MIPLSCRDQQGGECLLVLWLTAILLAEGSVASPAAGWVHGVSFIFSLLKHRKWQRNAGGAVDESFDANTLLCTESSKANELLMVFSESQSPHPAVKSPLWSPQCTST